MNFAKFAIACLAAVAIDGAGAATVGYAASNAPDAVSREILADPVHMFDEGATGPHDLARAIQRNFPRIIEQNVAAMTESQADAWVDQLGDIELEHLAQLYVNANMVTLRSGKLLDVMAHRLEGRRLARVARFFGSDEVFAAVAARSPHKMNDLSNRVVASHAAPVAGGILRFADGRPLGARPFMGGEATFRPSVTMTIPEIYHGFRSMHVGRMAVPAAVMQTTVFSGVALYGAWNLGYLIGGWISDLMQAYAPTFYRDTFVPMVGGTIAKAESYIQGFVVELFNDRGSLTRLGDDQAAQMTTFGVPSTPRIEMGLTGGDWDVMSGYEYYYSGGGGHGGCDCDDRDPY